MGDILRGAIGKFLEVGLMILGLLFFLVFPLIGILSNSTGMIIVGVLLGILCWCFAFGIRYWLGRIFRSR